MIAHADKAKSIFLSAAEIAQSAERQAYLDARCAGDLALRREVDDLLRHFERVGSFMESPAAGPDVTVDASAPSEGPGTVIGLYKLLEQIGEGGMGLVFVAEQQRPVRRRVALKIIKPGMDSRQVIARFEAESHALAMMDHPNIAKVHDGGSTPEGRPYFVMELVKGTPITDYCDATRLPTRDRLKLFLDVCHAVQHAHQKGIIHRDIKPSNVLVSVHDTTPVVKIIDFGIAKAMGGELTEKTVYTQFAQMLGTPLYMSPEQAGLSDLDVDTRSDVYSLGVLLYELLTGTTPFDSETLKKAGYDEMRRIIREEEPPRPSTRLSTLEAAALSTIAEKRGAEPRKLRLQFQGELDWIVMKALEKDRNRRYESASALAADLRRHLDNQPVQACPPSAGYRLKKFARRNKGVLLTVVLVTFALLAGSTVSVWQAVLATRERTIANEQAARADRRSEQARHVVDKMYTEIVERWLSQEPQMEQLQQEILLEALSFYRELSQAESNSREVRNDTASAYGRVASIQLRLGRLAEAEEASRQAVELSRRLVEADPQHASTVFNLAITYEHRSAVLREMGRKAEALETLKTALHLLEDYTPQNPTEDHHRRKLLAKTLHGFGTLLPHKEAESYYRRAIGAKESLVKEFPKNAEHLSSLAASQNNLARVLRDRGELKEARRLFEQAITHQEAAIRADPRNHGSRQFLRNHYMGLGETLAKAGAAAEAVKAFQKSHEIQERLVTDFLLVPGYREPLFNNCKCLGDLFEKLGNLIEAERWQRCSLEAAERFRADFPASERAQLLVSWGHNNLGNILAQHERLTDALPCYQKALQECEKLVARFPDNKDYREQLARRHKVLNEVVDELKKVEIDKKE